MSVDNKSIQSRNRVTRTTCRYACLAIVLSLMGCGTAGIFNPAFSNTLFGGIFPVTPGPASRFILVRAINNTDQNVEFIVTVEKEEVQRNVDGSDQFDNDGNPVTEAVRESVSLTTFPNGQARELGVLFPCGRSPVTLIGLGENLLPSDSAVFVGGQGPAGTGGFGISAAQINPLVLLHRNDQGEVVGNFTCGDTVIFQAIRSPGTSGGVALIAQLLPGSEQPREFPGPSTFLTFERILETEAGGG